MERVNREIAWVCHDAYCHADTSASGKMAYFASQFSHVNSPTHSFTTTRQFVLGVTNERTHFGAAKWLEVLSAANGVKATIAPRRRARVPDSINARVVALLAKCKGV